MHLLHGLSNQVERTPTGTDTSGSSVTTAVNVEHTTAVRMEMTVVEPLTPNIQTTMLTIP